MKYPNTRQGRDQILDEIQRLTREGYNREDKGDCVTLHKVVKKGKICKEIHRVRFFFKREEREIISDTVTDRMGCEQAKGMLLGWSSPKAEVSNAVKAGLLDNMDKEILKADYGNASWLKKA